MWNIVSEHTVLKKMDWIRDMMCEIITFSSKCQATRAAQGGVSERISGVWCLGGGRLG